MEAATARDPVSTRTGVHSCPPLLSRRDEHHGLGRKRQLWTLEVRDQAASRLGFWRGVSTRAADGHLLAVIPHALPCCVHPEREQARRVSSYTDTEPATSGPTP